MYLSELRLFNRFKLRTPKSYDVIVKNPISSIKSRDNFIFLVFRSITLILYLVVHLDSDRFKIFLHRSCNISTTCSTFEVYSCPCNELFKLEATVILTTTIDSRMRSNLWNSLKPDSHFSANSIKPKNSYIGIISKESTRTKMSILFRLPNSKTFPTVICIKNCNDRPNHKQNNCNNEHDVSIFLATQRQCVPHKEGTRRSEIVWILTKFVGDMIVHSAFKFAH